MALSFFFFFSLSNNLYFLQYSFLYFSLSYLLYHSSGIHHPLCHDGDRSSLLHFKQSFVYDKFSCDPSIDYTKLSSWKVADDDCCLWDGVHCDDQSGHVIGLDLSISCLYGSINSSSPLFRLVHLTSLDLSYNNFNLSPIPVGIRSLSKLKRLDLSVSSFSGQIPSEILELSQLVSLDLSLNPLMLHKPSLEELVETLTNLTELTLSFVNISSPVPQSLSNLTSLTSLLLRNCSLHGEFPPAIFQLPNLRVLSLRYNPDLSAYLPEFQVGSPLEEMWLHGINFSGQLPYSIGNLKSLSYFTASGCGFGGLIPSSIGNLTKLKYLDLSGNYFSGNIPYSSLGNLLQLTYLSLSSNNFSSGTLHWIGKLTNLQTLYLVNTNSYGVIPSSFRNLTQLTVLRLGDNYLTGEIPSWVGNLTQLSYFDVSDNELQGPIPESVFGLPNLELLDLFSNNLSGSLKFDSLPNLFSMDLSINEFEGPLPIPPPSIQIYAVSQNKFKGDISPLFCNLTSISRLDLSSNNLSGKLPPCLENFASVLDLRNNSLSGEIPNTFTSGCTLKVMNFGQNKFEGEVPNSVVNCSKLEILSLEENQMDGVFPSWLSILPHLRVLSLRSNKFHGTIGRPLSKFEFGQLQIIDLSHNYFTGKLPMEYFSNWVAMKSVDEDQLAYMQAITFLDTPIYVWTVNYPYSIRIVIKGTDRTYDQILEFFVVIDLSSNRFEGEIPENIGTLRELQSLNLSNNMLTGHIPSFLRNLTNLEALDLSLNNLSGEIPIQLSFLTFLAVFNVSRNSLTGPIPHGKQFDTFENDSFFVNPGLCGYPLSRKCGNTNTLPLPPSEDEDEHGDADSPFELNWEIVLMGFGCGLVIGVSIGYIMDTRKYEWLVRRKFARWRRNRRN